MPLTMLTTAASAIGSVAKIGSALGSLFGSKKKQPKNAAPPDLVALRKIAEKAGFNPLTALHATGGGGWSGGGGGESPRLASMAALGDALQQVADTGFNREMQQIDKETAEIQRDVLRKQLETSTASSAVATGQRAFGYSIPQTVAPILESGRGSAIAPASSAYPMPRNAFDVIPVFNSRGGRTTIPKSWARAEDVRPYDMLMPGQETEMVGEFYGEVGAVGAPFGQWWNDRLGRDWESGPEQLVPPQVPSAGATRLDPIFVTPDHSRRRNTPYIGVYDRRPPMLSLGR